MTVSSPPAGLSITVFPFFRDDVKEIWKWYVERVDILGENGGVQTSLVPQQPNTLGDMVAATLLLWKDIKRVTTKRQQLEKNLRVAENQGLEQECETIAHFRNPIVRLEPSRLRNRPAECSYLAMVDKAIDQAWTPVISSSAPFEGRAKFSLQLNKSGVLSHIQLEWDSGNKEFDASARRAIDAVNNPLPAFPIEIQQEYIKMTYNFYITPAPSPPAGEQPMVTASSAKPPPPEIVQRIAKLPIPEVVSVESITHRLQSEAKSSSEKNRYLAMVEDTIDRQWVAPPLLTSSPLVILTFRIARSGDIADIQIQESSGHADYDAAAQRAVEAVSPLPPFPEDVKEEELKIQYRFIRD